jgi:predicted ArsR family transcriptional regulator
MMLDPIFHQVVRTRLAVLLASEARSFAQLKSALDVTDGNLDAHLRKLSAAGYLHSRMVTKGRPHTIYELSPSGRNAFETYREAMQGLLRAAGNEGK